MRCECSAFYSHGIDAHSCGVLCDASTGIVKNSWGGTWGEAGYLRMERGYSSWFNKKGMCGILSEPSYPTAIKTPEEAPVAAA